MMAGVGAAQLWAGFNAFLTAQLFREAAGLVTQIQGETIPTDKPGTLSMTVRQPAGVVLSMAPWNGAGVLAARAIAYPIVCGNTVVFRASETRPRTHAIITEILHEAGLPAGVLNFLTSTPEDSDRVVEAIIAHPAVRRVNFTGSTAVGRIIAEKAARHLKPALLELGGKAPLVVLDDADIDGAVNAAVFGSFLYQGQICMSTERFVVDETVADEFVSKFVARPSHFPLATRSRMQAASSGRWCAPSPATASTASSRTPCRRARRSWRADLLKTRRWRRQSSTGSARAWPSMTRRHSDRSRPWSVSPASRRPYGLPTTPSTGSRLRCSVPTAPGPPGRDAHPGRPRPRQWLDGAERGTGSLRRHEGQWLRPFRRPCRNQRVHGAQMDHHRAVRPAVPVLNTRLLGTVKAASAMQAPAQRPTSACPNHRLPGSPTKTP
jgi:hypothetical protein